MRHLLHHQSHGGGYLYVSRAQAGEVLLKYLHDLDLIGVELGS